MILQTGNFRKRTNKILCDAEKCLVFLIQKKSTVKSFTDFMQLSAVPFIFHYLKTLNLEIHKILKQSNHSQLLNSEKPLSWHSLHNMAEHLVHRNLNNRSYKIQLSLNLLLNHCRTFISHCLDLSVSVLNFIHASNLNQQHI